MDRPSIELYFRPLVANRLLLLDQQKKSQFRYLDLYGMLASLRVQVINELR